MLWTWFLTVESSIVSRRAISLFDSPWSIRSRISTSRVVSRASIAAGDCSSARGRHPLKQRRRHPRRDHHFAAGDALDRGDEILYRALASHVAGNARLGASEHLALDLRDRERHDLSARHGRDEGADDPDVIGDRGVEEDHVGAAGPQRVDGLVRACRGADDVDPALALEHRGEALAVQADVRHDQDSGHAAPNPEASWEGGVLPQ